MKTLIKVVAILSISLLCMVTLSFATDINMNLPSSNTQVEENTLSNESTNETTGANEMSTNRPNSTLTTTPSTTVSSTSHEETLSFSNILNIILIVVGVVLILLGIAILIRINS